MTHRRRVAATELFACDTGGWHAGICSASTAGYEWRAVQEPQAMTRASAEPAGERLRASGRLLAACAGPLIVGGLLLALVPALTESGSGRAHLRAGGLLGVAAATLLSLVLAVWMLGACRRGGSAFLAPMALGFLAKLAVLAGGTWLLYQPLRGLGSHVAFAVCFAVSVLAFQAVFTPVLSRARAPAQTSNSSLLH